MYNFVPMGHIWRGGTLPHYALSPEILFSMTMKWPINAVYEVEEIISSTPLVHRLLCIGCWGRICSRGSWGDYFEDQQRKAGGHKCGGKCYVVPPSEPLWIARRTWYWKAEKSTSSLQEVLACKLLHTEEWNAKAPANLKYCAKKSQLKQH